MSEEWFKTWFNTKYYHLLYQHRDETEARQFIDALLRFLNPNAKAKFLDVACGKGRHSIQLNQSGYRATGIDLSDNSIDIAKKHESETLHFYVQDIREPIRCSPYDFALNLFTSFGYFETIEEHSTSLRNIFNALNSGGIFVFDFLNTEQIVENFDSNESLTIDQVGFELKREIKNGFIMKRIKVTENQTEHQFTERVMAFSKDDLVDLLTKVGFKIKSIHGDYQMKPFTAVAPRVIIIAEKS
jgi:SAM-dependent methyltransferase